MRQIKLLLIGVIVIMQAGCASLSPWTHMKKEDVRDWKRKFEAKVPIDWMRFNMAKYFAITRDGMLLNFIRVDKFDFDDELEFTKKMFQLDMLPNELLEIEEDNFNSNQEVAYFKVLENAPSKVNDYDAYRIVYSYETQKGLKLSGIQYGFIAQERVYRIRYEATSQNYFESYKSDFAAFIDSFKVIVK